MLASPKTMHEHHAQQREDDGDFLRALLKAHPLPVIKPPHEVAEALAEKSAMVVTENKTPWPAWYKPSARRRRTPTELISAVAHEFGLTGYDIQGPGRARHLVHPRSVVVRILRDRGMSNPQIGKWLGGRDHSTIINLSRNFEIYARMNPVVQNTYARLADNKVEA